MRTRVSELGHSHNYGLQDGGRCVRAIIAENDSRGSFCINKSVYVGKRLAFSCVF